MLSKLIAIFALVQCAKSASTYNQGQTGELNVQVDLKDLKIFAILNGGKEEYVDYDYAYDYNEMTIKPPRHNSTTAAPLNVTQAANASASSNSSEYSLEMTTELLSAANVTLSSTTLKESPQLFVDITTKSNLGILPTENTEAALDIKNATESIQGNGCKKGLVLNQKGDCEIKLQQQGPGNALLKLVKLSQKLKLKRRENRKEAEKTESPK